MYAEVITPLTTGDSSDVMKDRASYAAKSVKQLFSFFLVTTFATHQFVCKSEKGHGTDYNV
ncbi:hypothetical protein J6590_001726 [Homalodisca vitripennis]|nr:hypothetical protein J6590_001726 [Homalodisca vitripennis]